MNSLEGFTYLQVAEMLERGLRQGHEEGGWKKKTVKHHVDKAEGHIMQYWDAKEGRIKTDENHLQNALCRLAMALWVESNET